MAKDGTVAERFVAEHCNATFLSLWGMPNPVGKDLGKELCDYLVVCYPDIVIISVRDIRLPKNPNKVAADRWRREAIERSARSVYGAERLLGRMTEVRSRVGRMIKLPPPGQRRIHRICVAFGNKGKLSVPMGNFGKGFVHVLDEVSFPTLLRELDTKTFLTTWKQNAYFSTLDAKLYSLGKRTCSRSICSMAARFRTGPM